MTQESFLTIFYFCTKFKILIKNYEGKILDPDTGRQKIWDLV
jgi:hypothetical protein